MFFFFNDTATTEIYTLSLHDALPIWHAEAHPVEALRGRQPDLLGELERGRVAGVPPDEVAEEQGGVGHVAGQRAALVERRGDRKSTRLNSSHANISYAVFCLKKQIAT